MRFSIVDCHAVKYSGCATAAVELRVVGEEGVADFGFRPGVNNFLGLVLPFLAGLGDVLGWTDFFLAATILDRFQF